MIVGLLGGLASHVAVVLAAPLVALGLKVAPLEPAEPPDQDATAQV